MEKSQLFKTTWPGVFETKKFHETPRTESSYLLIAIPLYFYLILTWNLYYRI